MEFTSDPSTGYYLSPKPQNLTMTPQSQTRTRLLSSDVPQDQTIYQEMNQRPRTYAVRPNNMEDPEYMEVDYTDSRSPRIQMFLAFTSESLPSTGGLPSAAPVGVLWLI